MSLAGLAALVVATLVGESCSLPRKDNPATCVSASECGAGQTCDLKTNMCGPADGGLETLAATEAGDGRSGDGGPGGETVVSGAGGQAGIAGAGAGAGSGGGETGATGGGGGGVAGGSGPAGAGNGGGGIGGAVGGMVATGGAPGSCLTRADCTLSGKPFCSANLCVPCADAICAALSPAQPVCGVGALANTCQECNASATCAMKAGTPVCADGKCVACTVSTDCKSQMAPICTPATHLCGACADKAGCTARSASAPVCLSTGACAECGIDSDCKSAGKLACSAASTCVQCTKDTSCAGATPICDTTANTCAKCSTSDACKAKDPKLPVCLATPGTCVQCKVNADCGGATPGCSAANVCVACTDDSHCGGTTPICDTTANKCIPCVSDAQCAGKTSLPANPGVCMSHLDGHCALDTETLYVENKPAPGCSDGAAAGTRALPFCSMQGAVTNLASGKLILVRGAVQSASGPLAVSKVSVIGQNGALIAGGISPGIQVTSGSAYVRDLKVSSSINVGISASTGSTLRLQNLAVSNSKGGILLDGAAFDLENTNVSSNLASADLMYAGISIRNPPAGGPAKLNRVTVQNNMAVGISCSAMVTGTGVFASGNLVGDIAPACGFTGCAQAGPTCGSSVVP